MKTFILIILLLFASKIGQAQCDKTNYDKLIREGDQLAKQEKYINAVRKYMAATIICPDNNEKTQQKIVDLFNKIDELKIKAEQAKEIAEKELFERTYKSVSISASKMNVLYIGIDNPVDISVTGIDDDKLIVSIDSGSITKQGQGKYIVRVIHKGTATIKVESKFNDSLFTCGFKQFRVKIIADPIAHIGEKSSGNITINYIKEQCKIVAIIPNFDFDLHFDIIGFELRVPLKEGYVEKYYSDIDKFTDQQLELISKLKPGQKIYIEDILAKGPDGAIRSLPSLTFILK